MFKIFFLTGLYLNLISGLALASQKTIDYTGQSADVAELSSTESHTEYTYETVIRTCSRQVPDGYETICHKRIEEKRRICRMIDGRAVCTDEGSDSDDRDDDHNSQPSCYDRQTYRTEYYSCEEVISHPYDVFDYNTDGKVTLKFAAWPAEVNPSKALVTLSLSNAGSLSAQAEAIGQSPVFIFGRWSDEVRGGSGASRTVAATLNVSFQDAAKILSPLQSVVSDIVLGQQELTFLVDAGVSANDYELSFNVKKVRWFILKDKEIINTTLNSSQFKIEELGHKWRIHIPLLALAKFEVKDKYRFEFNMQLATEIKARLLNEQQLPTVKSKSKFKARFE